MAENIENVAVCKEIERNTKGMRKRLDPSIGSGKRDSAQPRLLEAILYKTTTERIRGVEAKQSRLELMA